jgi:Holliday junction resolvasome RuvABC endonuclease subunit
MIYNEGWEMHLYSPTGIKKTFTGSGRADKMDMYKQYIQLGLPCLYNVFDITPQPDMKRSTKVPAPISDIVDAFALIYSHKQGISTSMNNIRKNNKRQKIR